MRYMRIVLWCAAGACIQLTLGNAFGAAPCLQPPAVPGGYDFWATPSSGASADLTDSPIPAGCFTSLGGSESQAFGGTIPLEGLPFGPNGDPRKPADADTTVWRERDPTTCGPGGDAVDNVPIRMYALSLVSTSPVTIDYDDGSSELWNVTVGLSCQAAQPEGTLTAHRFDDDDGWFETSFEVYPLYTFTRVSGGGVVVIDSADRTHGTGGVALNAGFVTYDCLGPAGGAGGGFTPGRAEHPPHIVDPCWACFPDPNPCIGVLVNNNAASRSASGPGFSAVEECNKFITSELAKHAAIAAKASK